MLNILKPLYPAFFASLKSNPESAHITTLKLLEQLYSQGDNFWAKCIIQDIEKSFSYHHPSLCQSLWNLKFDNPLGLAPGFDKNAQGAGIWHSFGFGFAELGAVTLHCQNGNPLPRMFRLPKDKAILNRMGAIIKVQKLLHNDYNKLGKKNQEVSPWELTYVNLKLRT